MYCKSCGNEVLDNSKFCSNCGAQIEGQSAQNKVIETVTKTIGHHLVTSFTERNINEANEFFKSKNFGRVRWNFKVHNGLVRGITFTCEVMQENMPYYFQMDVSRPIGAGTFGALSRLGSLWTADKALNKWTQNNSDKKLIDTVQINHDGTATQVYILYAVKK